VLVSQQTIRSTPMHPFRHRLIFKATNLVTIKETGITIMLGKGNTYRRENSKPARPGRARRTRLAQERLVDAP